MVLQQNSEMEIPAVLLTEFDNGDLIGIYVSEDPKVSRRERVIWNHGDRFGIAEVAGVTAQNMCYYVLLRKMS